MRNQSTICFSKPSELTCDCPPDPDGKGGVGNGGTCACNEFRALFVCPGYALGASFVGFRVDPARDKEVPIEPGRLVRPDFPGVPGPVVPPVVLVAPAAGVVGAEVGVPGDGLPNENPLTA
jgi:hypothetical protein